eukprot:Skav202015  [mRNA]  locus=scaffold1138:34935:36116:+ [translate_table: standard]
MSGGLIFGSAPFQAALVKEGYSVEDAKTIWGCGFEIFVVGTAVSSPLLDYVGPRWFATLGLAVECVGHHLLARIGSYPLQQGRQFLAVGFGMIGMGGNMLMLGSIQFSALFVNSSTIAAMMSGAYQFAGFIFIILNEPFIKFDVFFVVYEVITAFGMCLVFVCYPNQPYTSPQTASCTWPSMPCPCRASAAVSTASCKESFAPLKHSRSWYFLLSFSLGATCGAWCSGTFLQRVTLKAHEAAKPQAAIDAFVFWMPLASNATFLISPCIGMLIDSRGFVPVVRLLCAAVATSVLSVWLLPFAWQWFTMVSLNWLQAVTYSLQFTYTARRYPAEQFGIIVAFTTVAQSVINTAGLYLLRAPAGLAAAAFILPSCFTCQMWCWKERTVPIPADTG